MKAAALFLALFLCAPSARASLPDLVQQMVKTYSTFGAQSPKFVGSGLLFAYQGKAYVLTSDHVVLHANGKYTHWLKPMRYTGGDGDPLPIAANFLAADYGAGLALLEVPSLKPDDSWITLDMLAPDTAAAGDKVTVMGFPYESETLISDPRGTIVDPESRQHLFVQVPSVIEIAGAHGEFGMSGGAAFFHGKRFAGVLSHQILKSTPGGKPTPGEWDQNDGQPENHLLLVPATTVYPWLKRYFANPAAFQIALFQDPQMQFDHRGDVYTGEFWLSYGHYFGSGEDAPGEVYIDVLKQPMTSATLEDGTGAFPRMRAYFASHSPEATAAYVLWFRPVGEKWPTGNRVRFHSFYEFFQLMLRKDLEPVIEVGSNAVYDLREGLYQEGREISKELDACRLNVIASNLYSGIRGIIDEFPEYVDDPAEQKFMDISRPMIDRLFDDPEYKDNWRDVELQCGNGGRDLRGKLQKLRSDYDRLTI